MAVQNTRNVRAGNTKVAATARDTSTDDPQSDHVLQNDAPDVDPQTDVVAESPVRTDRTTATGSTGSTASRTSGLRSGSTATGAVDGTDAGDDSGSDENADRVFTALLDQGFDAATLFTAREEIVALADRLS